MRKRTKRRYKRRRRRKANKGAVLDPYKRYQSGLRVSDVFPYRDDGRCACGCNLMLEGRDKRWFSKWCQEKSLIEFWVIKGDLKVIRQELIKRDKYICAGCGEVSKEFDADHILPVSKGGSACGIEGFQILCKKCHKIKTKLMYKNK